MHRLGAGLTLWVGFDRFMSERVSALLECYQLGEEVCNQQMTDRHLGEIASSYCRRWRTLRAELGLKSIVEHDIDCSNPGDEEGKRNAFFDKWKLMKGSTATYKVLISALLEIECRDDAEGVCKVLKQSLHKKAEEERSCHVKLRTQITKGLVKQTGKNRQLLHVLVAKSSARVLMIL